MDRNQNIWYFKNNQFHSSIKNLNEINNNLFLVVICSPSNSHLEYAKIFLKNSKFIFIEKPITNSLPELVKFKKYILKNKIFSKLCLGYNLRYLKSLIKLKKILSDKKLGKILYLNTRVGMSLDQWRNTSLNLSASKRKKGGGVTLELSHELDYLNWIFGPIKYVSSIVNTIKKFNLDVEESYFAHLLTKNKAPINLSVDMVRFDKIRECEVILSEGTVTVNIIKGTIKILDKNGIKNFKFKNDLTLSYERMWMNFFKKNSNSKQTIDNSLHLLDIVNKIKN